MFTRNVFTILLLASVALLTLAAAPTADAQGATAGGVVYHVVRPGEWLYQIARQYGVTPQAILDANHLTNPDWLYPGQVLAIPTQVAPGERIHTVRSGETLYRIGLMYGVSWQNIAALNNIRAPFTIRADQRLRIPPTLAGADAPDATVRAFYTWYLGDAQRHGSPLATRAYRSSPYLSGGLVQKVDMIVTAFEREGRGGFDPFLCAQDVPTSFSIRSTSVNPPQARAVVMTSFANHGFTVALQSMGGQWKMTDVTCEVQ